MKTFLVNLDRDCQRLEAMKSQLDRLGVRYERIPAVLGSDLPEEEKRKVVNHFRWWCTMCMPVTNGEIGCALSHHRIYEKMANEDIKLACVVEDDVELNSRFAELQAYVERIADVSRSQIFLFSNNTAERYDLAEPTVRPFKCDYYAECYAVTLPAARALRRVNLPMQSPCDHWARWIRRGVIEGYHVFPTMSRQRREEFGSNTNVGKTGVGTYSPVHKVFHKGLHAVGKCLDLVLPL